MNYEFITNITGGRGDGIVTTSRVAETGQAPLEEPRETHHTVEGSGASLDMKPSLPREVLTPWSRVLLEKLTSKLCQ